ncbi:LysR family transcriptional regulator [Pallidibacillus pasinlerensis]|uniref:LysR family transcriptional regulator n=1 Tax=Pallidibacillus pasinlerensis TaxID=2703818 RepID=A0ABX0A521_9BACI|nr:LysR family transcriptional regulator [Pallidibacillus pasinlerensis]NCU17912.1 LysR family transcriptional regulator [Pallidibacillus pasinlerensis]
MELRQLEYFLAVCKEMNFTRASEKLNISQPSLSQQIKNLEEELGIPLFDRIGKRISITKLEKSFKHIVTEFFMN